MGPKVLERKSNYLCSIGGSLILAKGNQRILLPSNRSYIEYAALKSENGVLKSSLAFEREIKERFETQKQAYN